MLTAMEKKICVICGRSFIPGAKNAKYCSGTCADKGQAMRRREWENRTGYREKRRKQAQQRREEIRAAAEADRDARARRMAEERQKNAQEARRIDEERTDALGRLMRLKRTGGNITPEYWEAFKEYDLETAAESRKISSTEVNGISVHADDFGRLVCDIIISGVPIICKTG